MAAAFDETLEDRLTDRCAQRSILASIAETTGAFIQAADFEFRWLAINRASADEFERIFGVRPVVGLSMLDVLADRPEHQAAIRAVWSRALAGEEFTEIGEFGDIDQRFYEMKYNVLRDAAGTQIGAFQIVTDVTERARAQKELADAVEGLRQSRKLEAIGQLTGGIAHDFNNMLQIVTGNLEVLQRSLEAGDARLKRLADNAMRGADRAAALTQRLLDFSRQGPGGMHPVNANALIAGMSDLVQQAVGHNIRVSLDLLDDLDAIEADPNQLESAILNLVVNARDAMPDGGTLTISSDHEDPGEVPGHGAGGREAGHVSIIVTDTGHGMDAATRRRAFEPFFTTKDPGRGTGLGLAMAQAFMHEAGGQIRVDSEPGQGTSVGLYFPRLPMRLVPDSPAAKSIVPQAKGQEYILVVEDNDDVRQHVVERLRELGYRVLEAHDEPSALSLFSRLRDRIDLLFCDICLPEGGDGTLLAAKARDIKPDLKILFTSGGPVDGETLRPGSDPLLAKPFSTEELANRIRDLLDQAADQGLAR